MLDLLTRLFVGAIKAVDEAMNRPEHIRLVGYGETTEECLRGLEKQAGLPNGDLYIAGDSMRVASWPTGLRSTLRHVFSKTSDEWKNNPNKKGYICGSILEPDVNLLKEGRLSFMGSLHVSKNCSGSYRQRESDGASVCTCGDVN